MDGEGRALEENCVAKRRRTQTEVGQDTHGKRDFKKMGDGTAECL